jgi:prepilin-type N-terminal cleavage/methylation domain-containing protein
MRWPTCKSSRSLKAFTLIELLIVIAIILILIAIALPNFLEAQARSKATKSYSEMRTLATAVEALRVERGVLLIDFWDDHSQLANLRIKNKFNGIGHWLPPCSPLHPDKRSMECVLFPLTSPVKYMTTIPRDPFAPDPGQFPGGNTDHDEHINLPGNQTYLYADRDSGINKNDPNIVDWNGNTFPLVETPGMLRPLKQDEFTFCGFGPAVEKNLSGNSVRVPFAYSPTNGTKSIGMLYYRSSSGTVNP